MLSRKLPSLATPQFDATVEMKVFTDRYYESLLLWAFGQYREQQFTPRELITIVEDCLMNMARETKRRSADPEFVFRHLQNKIRKTIERNGQAARDLCEPATC